MLVYMTHPNHGTHIAYSHEEIERCKANGWTVREDKQDEEKSNSIATNTQASDERTASEEGAKATEAGHKRRGRPRKAA